MLSELHVRERQIPYESHLYVRNCKSKTHPNKNRSRHIENKQVVASAGSKRGLRGETSSYIVSHGDITYTIRNRVNNTIITVWRQKLTRLIVIIV